MSHTVLSLDLGNSLGWALIEDNVIVASGVALLSKSSIEHPGKKFLRFQDWLLEFNGVDEIIFEDVRFFQGYYARRTWDGYFTTLSMFTASTGIRMSSITTSKWKKIFCDKGNADKKYICAECHKRGWKNGIPGTDNNNDEADSIAIAYAIFKTRDIEIRFEEDVDK